MPFSADPAKLLESILADIAKIERFTQGVDQTVFEQDDQVVYAVKYALLRIGEVAHRLKDKAAELCPDVPWRDIRGIGNRLRHDYDQIDTGLIWMILEKDLAPLKTAAQGALRELQSGRCHDVPHGGSFSRRKFDRLVQIMAIVFAGRLPLDREQSLETIEPYLLEETEEVLEAIDRKDWPGWPRN